MKNPKILQEFERRLEGAVEGFFARAFRSGLQPVELAKGVRRYAEEQRQVSSDAVVVPNAYRFRVNPKDADRLAGFGPRLADELAGVVETTARDEAWRLAGPVVIEVVPDAGVAYGMFRLVGRIDAAAKADSADAADAATPAPAQADVDDVPSDATDVDMTGAFEKVTSGMRLRLPDGNEVVLEGSRMVAGRLAENPLPVDHATVSRAHAAFVRRGDEWWVLDLGSTNGTKVNGRPAAEHPIHPGDRVELGEAVVEVLGG